MKLRGFISGVFRSRADKYLLPLSTAAALFFNIRRAKEHNAVKNAIWRPRGTYYTVKFKRSLFI
jgi:hypothetical protein